MSDTTTTRIYTDTLDAVRVLARQDLRSITKTLAVLVEAELARREKLGILRVDHLPRPSDGQVVPVVFVEKREG